MKVRTIRQAKRRIAIRLLLIMTSVFLIGAATGSAICMLIAVKSGLL